MQTLFFTLLSGTTAPLLNGECDNPFVSDFNFMKKEIELLIGEKYGRWLVIEDLGYLYNTKTGKNRKIVKCQCECGVIKTMVLAILVSGASKSCGCLRKDTTILKSTTHGFAQTDLYHIWVNIKGRCYNHKNISYKWYGAKGIDVCDEWRYNFINFKKWAILNGWQKGLQFDRKDNKLGYSPNNCRIVTCKVNCGNKTNNVLLTINGETKILQDWCNFYGIKSNTVQQRIKYGWTQDRWFIKTNRNAK